MASCQPWTRWIDGRRACNWLVSGRSEMRAKRIAKRPTDAPRPPLLRPHDDRSRARRGLLLRRPARPKQPPRRRRPEGRPCRGWKGSCAYRLLVDVDCKSAMLKRVRASDRRASTAVVHAARAPAHHTFAHKAAFFCNCSAWHCSDNSLLLLCCRRTDTTLLGQLLSIPNGIALCMPACPLRCALGACQSCALGGISTRTQNDAPRRASSLRQSQRLNGVGCCLTSRDTEERFLCMGANLVTALNLVEPRYSSCLLLPKQVDEVRIRYSRTVSSSRSLRPGQTQSKAPEGSRVST